MSQQCNNFVVVIPKVELPSLDLTLPGQITYKQRPFKIAATVFIKTLILPGPQQNEYLSKIGM